MADKDDPLAWLTSFTIVTTAAEPGLDRIHDRQPLVLEPDDWERWLDPVSYTHLSAICTIPFGASFKMSVTRS